MTGLEVTLLAIVTFFLRFLDPQIFVSGPGYRIINQRIVFEGGVWIDVDQPILQDRDRRHIRRREPFVNQIARFDFAVFRRS